MGLFGKYNKMTYDEALNLLMDGMVPTAVLKAAFKCVCKSKTNNARTELHFCLGMLCGVFKTDMAIPHLTACSFFSGYICFPIIRPI